MTKMNKDEATENTSENARIKRRSILKAGAVIAPLAITLHGGIPMAHASSAGACIEDLKLHVDIPVYEDSNGDGIHELTNRTTPFDPDFGLTGRTHDDDGSPETHWDYLKSEELYGASCLASIENSGHDEHVHHDHHGSRSS